MNKKQKLYLIVGTIGMNFIYSMTSPIIHTHFMRLISPRMLSLSNMICTSLMAITCYTITKDKFIELYRKYFNLIVIADIICFVLVSFLGIEYPAVRFIGLSILNAISTNIWCMIMRNSINNIISGDDLTKWNSFEQSLNLFASLIGGVVMFIVADYLPLEICIGLQCIANLIFGITDLIAYKLLNVKQQD